MFELLETVDGWLAAKRPAALATVVETWGSAPRGTGAKMAITSDMAMVGSVSGGCVEGAVIEEAIERIADGGTRLLHFGVADDTAWEVGLTCGGSISVFVEPLDAVWWSQASQFAREQKASATVTVLDGDLAGEKLLVDAAGNVVYATAGLYSERQALLLDAAAKAIKVGKSSRQQIEGLDVMVDVYRPQPRLILIGAVHVAIALHNFAQQLGFRVILIDPRTAFSTPERFPNVELMLHSYPDKALPQVGIDADTYIAVLTHDPKIDDPALRIALSSPAPYIGVLSSRKTHEQRVKRLLEQGVDPAQLERLRTPIGLNIDGGTPEEIALSIMAEIVAVRNGAAIVAKAARAQA
jgi:xanthine dehydrogenase accessory factor